MTGILKIEKYIIRFLEYKSDKYAYLKRLPPCSRVLDIGCGDCRRLRYRTYFRDDLIHYGIDIEENKQCRHYLKEFYSINILHERLPFDEEFFDAIIMSHVIEHLPKDKLFFALRGMERVLKRGGYVYLEFPSEKTRSLVRGETLRRYSFPANTFNFFDDATHISLYSVHEVIDIFEKEGFKTCAYGEVREPIKKILSPLLLMFGYVKRDESLFTGVLWSIVNWASYVIVQK